MAEINQSSEDSSLFSRSRIKKYLLVGASFFGITAISSLLSGLLMGTRVNGLQNPPQGSQTGFPPNSPPGGISNGDLPLPPSDVPPAEGLIGGGPGGNVEIGIGNYNSMWPMWGEIVIPTWVQLLLGLMIFGIFAGIIYFHFKKSPKLMLPVLLILGIITMIATNLIQGWDQGIFNAIGGRSEIFTDAVQITNFIEFIKNFEQLQVNLSIHAQTQPPGAVLTIYLFTILFDNAGIIAIALSIIASLGSAFFLNGIFKQLFDEDTVKYGVFLYLILPAVQVYYLANIYAIVAMLTFGVIYFYLKPKTVSNFIGAFICLFFLSIITYLFVWVIMFLGLFELIQAWRANTFNWKSIKSDSILVSLKKIVHLFGQIALMIVGLIGIYFGIYLVLGYNYINSFLYASELENPGGFMLFVNPLNYFITRIQDILDILFFFGPILLVLSWQGIKVMKKDMYLSKEINNNNNNYATTETDLKTISNRRIDIYSLVISAASALIILFLTGVAKKGETARICLFILPFLLIPILVQIARSQISKKEKVLLLLLVLGQTILMQTFGSYIW